MSGLPNANGTDSLTVKAIYSSYKQRGESEQNRTYLGCSEIGHVCERYLWYKYRNFCRSSFDGRMYRLFDTGNLEESRLVSDLRSIGCEVHDVDENGQQFAVSALGGNFSGHMDGCALGIPEAPKTWHVLEFKTHNSKSFAKLAKDGVKKYKPQHYAQCQVYMHLSGMTRALYLARNKDTDELYSERIHYDHGEALILMDRAERIITDQAPPGRISTRPDYFECSWCPAKSICWNETVQKAEEVFGATVMSIARDDIISRYPASDSRVLFNAPIGLLRVEWQRLYGEDIEQLKPIAMCDGFDYRAAEYEGGRCVILWTEKTKIGEANCEIRIGIE